MKASEIVYFFNHKYGEVAYLFSDSKEIEILTAKSKWKIHLLDITRGINKYTLSHLNYNGDRVHYHRQASGDSLGFLIFMAIRHDLSLPYSWDEWESFQKEWDNFIYGQKLLESCSTWAFLSGEDWYFHL